MTTATQPDPLAAGAILSAAQPLDLWAWMAGGSFALLAGALWVASCYTDRAALRLFALRYLLASLAWFFAHPRQISADAFVSFPSIVIALVLLVMTLAALDLYLGQFRWCRLALQGGAALLACAGLRLLAELAPNEPRGLYGVLSLGMLWCALVAWRAARRERNAGHLIIALAFCSFPVVVVLALLLLPQLPPLELTYLVAIPTAAAGLAILLASLIRFSRRLETELARRHAAERQVRELNTTLEQRVNVRTAELRHLVRGLEAFTRTVAHDLRGPLAGMAGVVRLAQNHVQGGDLLQVQRLLTPLATQADHMVSMVHDLMRLSSTAQGDCERRRQPLRPVVDAALKQLERAPDTVTILPEVRLELGPLPEAHIDAALMQQAFVNLLANALRFSRAASEKPVVRVGAEEAGGRTTFYVADNGPGIPVGREPELFKPFSRLHGTGLSHNGIGLSIVHHIIEKHRGRIWAERAPGGGTVFRFQLDAPQPA